MSVIGRVLPLGAEAKQPARPQFSAAVRALLGSWLQQGAITSEQTAPSALEQAICIVLDAYTAEMEARIEALEKRNQIITRL